MGKIFKIIFMLIPILFGKIYADWPIWLNTVLFLIMLFVPLIGFIVEEVVWLFALASVIRAPFTSVSLLFYILLVVYEWSVVSTFLYRRRQDYND